MEAGLLKSTLAQRLHPLRCRFDDLSGGRLQLTLLDGADRQTGQFTITARAIRTDTDFEALVENIVGAVHHGGFHHARSGKAPSGARGGLLKRLFGRGG